ncbi:hypothetical protein D3C73_1355690 [compost metagenome]
MAGAGITHFQANIDNAALGLKQQMSGATHAQADEILRWRQPRGTLEHPAEVILAQIGDMSQMRKAELIGQVFIHRIDDASQLVRL